MGRHVQGGKLSVLHLHICRLLEDDHDCAPSYRKKTLISTRPKTRATNGLIFAFLTKKPYLSPSHRMLFPENVSKEHNSTTCSVTHFPFGPCS